MIKRTNKTLKIQIINKTKSNHRSESYATKMIQKLEKNVHRLS